MARNKQIKSSVHKRASIAVLSTASVILCIVVLVTALALSTYVPRSGISSTDYSSVACENNQYISEQCKVSAHRAGSDQPENTLLAFKSCIDNYATTPVDVLEFDLHITKDRYLVVIHDDTLDRTSDCGRFGLTDMQVKDYDLATLKKFNMGYSFCDSEGNYPYRIATDKQLESLRIITVTELFSSLSTWLADIGKTLQDFSYIIEIKNDGALGKQSVNTLYRTLCSFGILRNTIVSSFHDDVLNYIDETYITDNLPLDKQIIRGAATKEALNFYFSCMFNVDLSKKGIKYSVLQLPYRDYVLNLGKKAIIDYAHKYGIAVYYWTIDDPVEIAYLDSIGADGIISNKPETVARIVR